MSAKTSKVYFCWPYPVGKELYVAGTFSNWKLVPFGISHPPSHHHHHHHHPKVHRISMQLHPGKYQYKYVLEDEDGTQHWCYDSAKEITVDESGNVNNVLVVTKEKSVAASNRYYLTTAINYTNGPPHFGHAYEAIAADTLVRYQRLLGKDVFFVTGTDEHGQKVAETAALAGVTPIELCDRYVALFKALNAKLKVEEDFYIRTTMEKHEKTCQWLWNKAVEAGDIYLSNYEGWYNVREEKFVTESEAEKTNFLDPGSGKPLIKTSEPSYFFRMSKYQQKLMQHIYENPGFIFPEERESEVLARLREPLLDLSISRTNFEWGVPCPPSSETPQKHVMYVWYDALTNYLSAVDYPDGEKSHYWPADVHLIGKDIVWFHAVIWPCMLMSANIPLPKQIITHGFVNAADGRKMSKSYGNVIDPEYMLNTYSADVVRYFCLREGIFGDDFAFSEQALKSKHDADLADDLGNLVHRSLTLSEKWNGGKVPNQKYIELFSLSELIKSYTDDMNEFHIQQAFEVALEGVKTTNKWLADKAPWKNEGTEDFRLECVRTALEAVYLLAHFFYPLIPTSCDEIFKNLNKPRTTLAALKGWGNLTPGASLAFSGEIIFKKIQQNRFEKAKAKAAAPAASPAPAPAPTPAPTHAPAPTPTPSPAPAPAAATVPSPSPSPAPQEKPEATEKAQPKGKQQQQQQGGKQKGGAAKKAEGPAKPVDISRLNLRVGKILTCKNHPEADHLYIEEIDVGETKPRQVVSGLAKHIPLDKMTNRLCILVTNMKPGNFRGVNSQAMVIAATSAEGVVDLLNPPEGSTIGERVIIAGYDQEPDAVLDAKKENVVAAVKPDMTTDASGVATYKNIPWTTSAGNCTSHLKNAHLG